MDNMESQLQETINKYFSQILTESVKKNRSTQCVTYIQNKFNELYGENVFEVELINDFEIRVKLINPSPNLRIIEFKTEDL